MSVIIRLSLVSSRHDNFSVVSRAIAHGTRSASFVKLAAGSTAAKCQISWPILIAKRAKDATSFRLSGDEIRIMVETRPFFDNCYYVRVPMWASARAVKGFGKKAKVSEKMLERFFDFVK
ncbi:hypothetical protein TcasGA2_TC015055 [Tribolium castaneum]|uniref:Uncharacterized protein n=1 Tax=Tribolium castaneum TaxID=7070 RepID=D2A655_TRICA|nr:hypothetical protein TcasGA2_TC015055 [Tribolium castaneum]